MRGGKREPRYPALKVENPWELNYLERRMGGWVALSPFDPLFLHFSLHSPPLPLLPSFMGWCIHSFPLFLSVSLSPLLSFVLILVIFTPTYFSGLVYPFSISLPFSSFLFVLVLVLLFSLFLVLFRTLFCSCSLPNLMPNSFFLLLVLSLLPFPLRGRPLFIPFRLVYSSPFILFFLFCSSSLPNLTPARFFSPPYPFPSLSLSVLFFSLCSSPSPSSLSCFSSLSSSPSLVVTVLLSLYFAFYLFVSPRISAGQVDTLTCAGQIRESTSIMP